MGDSRDRLLRVAQAVTPAVREVGSAFGRSDEFAALIDELGVGRWPTYFAGRTGVMGDVRPETAAAVLGFFAPGHVAEAMAVSAAVGTPMEIAGRDLAAMDRWGQVTFGRVPDVAATATLAERIVAGAEPSGLALFAALRAQGGSPDPGSRLARALMCLREHRGGLYLLACRAVGLTPLEAILAQGGPDKAEANGWRPPFAPSSPAQAETRQRAEDLADRLAAPAFGALTEAEAKRFVASVRALEPLMG